MTAEDRVEVAARGGRTDGCPSWQWCAGRGGGRSGCPRHKPYSAA